MYKDDQGCNIGLSPRQLWACSVAFESLEVGKKLRLNWNRGLYMWRTEATSDIWTAAVFSVIPSLIRRLKLLLNNLTGNI
jgi:hypothetical protein